MNNPNTLEKAVRAAEETKHEAKDQFSPARLAWQQLYRNPAAMACMILLTLCTLCCFTVQWWSPHDPIRVRSWLGPMDPGSTSIDCLIHNEFRVGEEAIAAPSMKDAQQVQLSIREQESTAYRISFHRRGSKKGLIKLIQRVEGAIVLDELALDETSFFIATENEKGESEYIPLPAQTLSANKPFPHIEGLTIKRSLEILERGAASEHDYVIELNEGIVSAIYDGENRIDSLAASGKDISAASADGASLQLTHLFGTDHQGRDVLTRMLHGGQISLLIGIIATVVSIVIGIVFGAVSGYLGGRWDRIMMGAVDVLYAIPFMFIVIILLVAYGRNMLVLFAALGAVQWLTMARIVRGQILTLKHREFIEAAYVNGCSHLSIIFRHLIPNCLGPIIVYTTLTVPVVILEESFLAFIGLQVEWRGENLESWGALIKIGQEHLNPQSGHGWWMLVFPATLMAGTLLALNIIGDILRDVLDPRQEGRA